MSEVKLPDINRPRGASRGPDTSGMLNEGGQVKRSSSFASMGPSKSVFNAKKERKE